MTCVCLLPMLDNTSLIVLNWAHVSAKVLTEQSVMPQFPPHIVDYITLQSRPLDSTAWLASAKQLHDMGRRLVSVDHFLEEQSRACGLQPQQREAIRSLLAPLRQVRNSLLGHWKRLYTSLPPFTPASPIVVGKSLPAVLHWVAAFAQYACFSFIDIIMLAYRVSRLDRKTLFVDVEHDQSVHDGRAHLVQFAALGINSVLLIHTPHFPPGSSVVIVCSLQPLIVLLAAFTQFIAPLFASDVTLVFHTSRQGMLLMIYLESCIYSSSCT